MGMFDGIVQQYSSQLFNPNAQLERTFGTEIGLKMKSERHSSDTQAMIELQRTVTAMVEAKLPDEDIAPFRERIKLYNEGSLK